MNLRSAARLSGLILVLGAFGCTDDGYEITDLSNQFEVSPAYLGVDEGLPPIQYSATQGGTPVTVTWESSDPAVATVSAAGVVTPLNDGFAAITATQAGGTKKSASLTVNALFGTPLVSGTTVTGINGAVGDTDLLYRIYVPEGATNLRVQLAGGTGDLDIYVVKGPNVPSYDNWACRPYAGGNNETCNFPNPESGTWYIWIDVYEAAVGATLTATVTP
jgi:hypothetical protein